MSNLIDRQAAIDALNEVYCHIEMIKKRPVNKTEQAIYRDMIGAVKSVPSAQRTGKWIKLDMHRGMASHKCTACEQECYVPTCMGEPLYAFCPNCGSYNGGEQDE